MQISSTHKCHVHRSSRFDRPVIYGQEVKSWNSSLWNSLQHPVGSYLFGPNIFLSALFSKNCFVWYCPTVTNQFSHPDKTRGKLAVGYFNAFVLIALMEYRHLTQWTSKWRLVSQGNILKSISTYLTGWISVVQLTNIDYFIVGYFLAFLHVLYVSHKLNLLMFSSCLS